MLQSSAVRRAGIGAAAALVPAALACRFALVYRARTGHPRRHEPLWSPADLGLRYEDVVVATGDGLGLPAWFLPAGPGPAPGVGLVHGWESSRDRMLPHAQFLHAAGFHVLAVDVRGHGRNGPEALPVTAGEFAADAAAAARWLASRPEVAEIGLLGHSMGAIGVLVAGAAEPRVRAVVSVAAPADPYRLTRQTFRLASLPIPGLLAWPLAWLTTRVVLRPRGHTVSAVSASRAVRAVAAPVLLVHGDADRVVPVGHLARLAGIRRAARPDAVTESLVVPGGEHSWLFESADFRAAVARFLAASLGGPLDPDAAARSAAAAHVARLPEPERLTVLDEEPGGLRSLLRLFRHQAPTRPNPPSQEARP